MNSQKISIAIASLGWLASCAASTPRELVNAREANRRAAAGPAAQVAPAELHVASRALAQAEHSFDEDSDSYRTRDLAYVAERKAELAEATAAIILEQQKQALAQENYTKVQGEIVAQTKQDLSLTRTALQESEQSGEATAQQLSAEQKARAEAEQRAAAALAALAAKEDARGTVITLSGSVLFASNQTTLLPAAQARLDQVADVLLASRERPVVIEGYTDSRGTDAFNVDLSQRRAEAVRSYLVQKGYEADRITARGMGEGKPIADNESAEGRANNRRVEIVIERSPQASIPSP